MTTEERVALIQSATQIVLHQSEMPLGSIDVAKEFLDGEYRRAARQSVTRLQFNTVRSDGERVRVTIEPLLED